MRRNEDYVDHARNSDKAQPFLTVAQFSARNPVFSEAALRNMIFKAYAKNETAGRNGLVEAGAILRLGRKVLIDEAKFLQWVRDKQ